MSGQELLGLAGSPAVAGDLEETDVMGGVPQLFDEFRTEGTVGLPRGTQVQNRDGSLIV